jgi:hypothetical protein
MKKAFLLIILFISINLISFAQISISVAGSQTDISGNGLNPYVLNVDPTNDQLILLGYVVLDLELQNNTGSPKSWRITREKVSVASDWNDQLCIPGACYSPSGNIWPTPADNPVLLNNAEKAPLNLHFTPGSAAGNATYRYYIGDGTTFEDSVEIRIAYVLGLKNSKPTNTLSIGPNPASDQIFVSSTSNEPMSIKIIDVLGNNVYSETLSGNKKIDVSDFKNGIYFVTLESSDTRISNRKLIIRH